MDKRCFKCNMVKPINDFYTHPRMKDGRLGKCKECTKKDVATLREKDSEQSREKDRSRYQIKKKNKVYMANRVKRNRLWRTPEKVMAHNAVHRKLKNPGVCSECGSTKFVQGHHEDYSKPLEAIWYCSVCHHKFTRPTVQQKRGNNSHD